MVRQQSRDRDEKENIDGKNCFLLLLSFLLAELLPRIPAAALHAIVSAVLKTTTRTIKDNEESQSVHPLLGVHDAS